jgi:hypothetical protein
LFLHCQTLLFEKQIKKIEKSDITIVEVKKIINDLEQTLSECAEANFLGIKTKIEYNKIKDDDQLLVSIKLFDEGIDNYYKTSREYLKQWSNPLIKFLVFSWMNLTYSMKWQDVEKTITYLKKKGIDITDSCFEKILYLINFIDKQKFDEDWNKNA